MKDRRSPMSEAVRLATMLLYGRRFERIERFEPPGCGWWFHFDGQTVLTIEAGWRLVSDTAIKVSNEDDGHVFGRETAVDAAVEVTSLLGGKSVSDILIGPVSSDLTVDFGPTLRLQVINLSSGYEAWNLAGQDGLLLVGRSEDIVIFPGRTPM
jgi:hypothetical protein